MYITQSECIVIRYTITREMGYLEHNS